MRFPKRIRIGPELRKRLIYTILLVGLFRGLTLVPVFDVQPGELDQILAENPLLGAIDLFAGGEVIVNFSIVGAGIFPVILATLIVNGATWFVPRLRELRELGEAGRKRLKIYSRVLTILMAFLIAWAITELLSAEIGLLPGKIRWLTWASLLPSLKIILLFTLGSTLATAISDLITNKGVYEGEGVLLIVGVLFSFCSRGRMGPSMAATDRLPSRRHSGRCRRRSNHHLSVAGQVHLARPGSTGAPNR